jgi:predicted HicB family RNase H-like nuclease
MATTKRKFMAVTMVPELYARAVAAAAKRDIPVTAWVREVVIAELERMGG